MAQLSKRTRWRPVVGGEVIRGGAGGFHHSQTGRVTSLTVRKRRTNTAAQVARVNAANEMLGQMLELRGRRSIFARAFDKLSRKAA